MIRVALVDDHHAIRLGLQTALAAEHDLVPVGAAATAADLMPLLYRADPDVVLLDYNLPDRDGLTLCREIKSSAPAPGVVLYSAFADASMTVPAIVAGADGLIHKSARPHELFTAIRTVAGGGSVLPPISPALLEAAGLALDPEDLPILAMLVDRTSSRDIAATLRLEPGELRHRVRRMLGRLRVPVPEPARAGSSGNPGLARRQSTPEFARSSPFATPAVADKKLARASRNALVRTATFPFQSQA